MATSLYFGDLQPDTPYLDGSGRPLANAKLTFYRSGTTKPITVYSDEGLTTPITTDIVSDSEGVFPTVYLDPMSSYRVKLEDSLGRLVWDVDPYLFPANKLAFLSPVYQAREDGAPVPGAELEFKEESTPIAIYADGDLEVRLPNPIKANAGGFFPPIYLAIEDPPFLESIDPSSAIVYSDSFVMTLTGQHFSSSSVVLWDGAVRTPTFVSSTELRLTVPFTDLGEVDVIQVSVRNLGGLTSNSLPFEVEDIPWTIVALTSTTPSTWTVPAGVSEIALLAVGGGGGGGSPGGGGGGGAGEVVYRAKFSVTPGADVAYQVGAGGNADVNGMSTTFGSVTALGGGAGAVGDTTPGQAGGSGGGGGNGFGGKTTDPGDSIADQGFGNAGGVALPFETENAGGAGGGGAGQPGENTLGDGTGSDGGDGLNFSYVFGTTSGEDGWFGGGGGGAGGGSGGSVFNGGRGGRGGGGDARPNDSPRAPIANSGGGGGAFPAGGAIAIGADGIILIGYGGTIRVPEITAVAPDRIKTATQTEITITGTGFVSNAVATLNGIELETTFVSSTELTGTIDAADIPDAGDYTLVVANPGNGGAISEGVTVEVRDEGSVPVIASISPEFGVVGGEPFTLTVSGSSFDEEAVVRVNGVDRETTFVSSTELTIEIGAEDLEEEAELEIKVFNPPPGGGLSEARTLSILEAPPWTPADIETALWFDAADATTITLDLNGRVAQWNDKSGNDRHVSQATTTRRPLYVENAQNGRAVLRFDANPCLLVHGSSSNLLRNIGAAMAFMVVRHDTGTTNAPSHWLVIRSGGGLTRFSLGSQAEGKFSVAGRRLDSDSQLNLNSTADVDTEWHILEGVRVYTDADMFLYLDGELDASDLSAQGSGNTSNTASADFAIGQYPSLTNDPLDGDLSEIILVEGDVSKETREIIEGYLAWRWGLVDQLPAEHPYKDARPLAQS